MEFNFLQAFDVGTDLVSALFIGREDFGALVERLWIDVTGFYVTDFDVTYYYVTDFCVTDLLRHRFFRYRCVTRYRVFTLQMLYVTHFYVTDFYVTYLYVTSVVRYRFCTLHISYITYVLRYRLFTLQFVYVTVFLRYRFLQYRSFTSQMSYATDFGVTDFDF